MFPFNDTFETPPEWLEDGGQPSHYTSLPQQQITVQDNFSCNDLQDVGEYHQESYPVAGFSPNSGSWSNNAFPDPSFPLYGVGAWSVDVDETRLGSSFGIPENSGSGPDAHPFTGMQIAAPSVEQASPFASRALSTSQSYPLPPTWTHAPGPSWQPNSPLHHPVHVATQYNEQSPSMGSLGMSPEIPLAASSAFTHHLERRHHPTHSVQFSTHNDPVLVSSSAPRPRGDRLDSSDLAMFQCLWTTHGMQCMAPIAGDRKSVTSHLRDEHNFTCDGQTIECAWLGCTTPLMKRRSITRHIITCHLAIKVTCSGCGMALSRADASKKHQVACSGVKTPAVTEQDEGGYF